MAHVTLERATAAKRTAVRRFQHLADVVGIGITRLGDDYAVKINLRGPARPDLPAEIDGVPVRVEVTGSIRPR